MNNNLTDLQIDAHLSDLAKSKSLDDYCTNCGDCCSPSVMVKSVSHSPFKILVTDLKCKFNKSVNGESNCTVYGERFQKAGWCLDLKGMIKEGAAPGDCPYVDTLKGYTPTHKLESTQYGTVLPLLKKAISSADTSPFEDVDIKKFLGE
tara:strand:- start:764 stop:1210 length:447 start_codon:yes stop_codon:yes gene_type:complete